MSQETQNYGAILKKAFEHVLTEKFGSCVPPPSYTTPYGIRHLDVLLGGGLTSSAPVAFSSTPESGKSSLALQFCGSFLKTHENSVVAYIDTESGAGDENSEIKDRIKIFGIDENRFLYKSFVGDISQVFELFESFINFKMQLQEKTKQEVFVCFVLDSIASPGSSRDASADDPNSVIGYKARELSFTLSKYRQHLSMQRCTFITIDQVRANMQIQSRWQAASEEKSVGTFGNFKSATNVNALQHNIRQWLWLSKGEQLKPTDPLGVDGWVLHLYTEKNKLVSSKYSVPLVFDKKFGAVPVLSEYYFLSNKTKTEKRYWPDKKPLLYPLCITGDTNKRVLSVMNPETGEIMYESEKFNERGFLEKYNVDSNFKGWFDYAVAISAQQRIQNALFRNDQIGSAPEVHGSDVPTGESVGISEVDQIISCGNVDQQQQQQQQEDSGDY